MDDKLASSSSTDSVEPPGGAQDFNNEPFLWDISNQNPGITSSASIGDQGIRHYSEPNCSSLDVATRGGSSEMRGVSHSLSQELGEKR